MIGRFKPFIPPIDAKADSRQWQSSKQALAFKTTMKSNSDNLQDVMAPMGRGVLCSLRMRLLISMLGGLMVATTLYRLEAGAVAWGFLLLWAVLGPIAVCCLGHTVASTRVRAQEVWLLSEVAAGGILVALMQFNLLPSVIIVTACASAAVMWSGRRSLWRMPLALLLGGSIVVFPDGLAMALPTDMVEMLATLPVLVALPVTLALAMRSLTLRMRSQSQQLNRVSRVDSLSGLLNRGCWEEQVNALMAGRRRRGSMLVMDIDHFKNVNDTWGHTTGDDVVAKVGAIIQASVRANDIAGRYGGDEFAVVLDGADVQIATVVAERIRTAVAAATIDGAADLHSTISVGIAPVDARMQDARDWVKSADAALYRAKRSGRDRSMVAGWPPSLVGSDIVAAATEQTKAAAATDGDARKAI